MRLDFVSKYRLIALAMLAVLLLPLPAAAQKPVRVVVFPFEINAPQKFAYLADDVARALQDHFRGAGAVVLEPELPARPETEKGIRHLAASIGADVVVWGSLTVLGERFSIDARFIRVGEPAPLRGIYGEGQGMENLLGTLRKVARDLEIRIFHRQRVADVKIEGNKRIEADAIRRVIKTAPGDILSKEQLSQDIRSIYQMGYFEDIQVETEKGDGGQIVVFHLTEKPTIRVIRVEGAGHGYDEKEILDNLDIKSGSILNIARVRRNVQRIEGMYKEKNYHNVKVDYKVIPLKTNQVDLEFTVDEGEKIKIKEIRFEGNNAYSDDELKDLMKTSEEGFFSFITQSGELNREDLDQDMATLSAFYQNHGYIQARIADPEVDLGKEYITITIRIDEGKRFRFGKVDIEGDMIFPKEQLLKKIKITGHDYYNRELVRKDVLALKSLYANEGYAYADVTPRIERNEKDLVVDITYTIDKGSLVYFEKIVITGNDKTRDKVIRRELKVYEKELFSEKRMKRSMQNLYRLDYFEDIKVDTPKGSADDQMVLNIDVTEKPTGSFQFGGGYSSAEDFYMQASISQRNLFGRGQILSLDADLGGRSTRFSLRFTEPWLFDIPLSAGFSLYDWKYDYDSYVKNSLGGILKASYPVWDHTRAGMAYRYDSSEVSDIVETAADSIKELEGTNVTSSVTGSLIYDSRDRVFNTSHGSKHTLSVEYAGSFLGGDIGFVKYLAETGWYFPAFWDHVLFVHGKGGVVTGNGGGLLPDYERFYLGGMNSIRGFDWQEIHAVDDKGATIGGDKFVQGNVEYRIPLLKDAGIVGVVFFDIGNVYGQNESIDLGKTRESAGLGFRWYSPVGPIRLEYGKRLDTLPGEDSGGKLEFSMGSAF